MLVRSLINPSGLLTLGALSLVACAAPTPYQPATRDGGYAEQQIETNRFRVRFSGNSLTPRDTVENYLLYRAAEVTLKQGKDYFIITDRQTEPRTVYQEFGGPIFYDERLRFDEPWRPWHSPLAMSSGTAMPITDYIAYADVEIFAGPKPANDPHAYDARDVIAKLDPAIRRPEPAAN